MPGPASRARHALGVSPVAERVVGDAEPVAAREQRLFEHLARLRPAQRAWHRAVHGAAIAARRGGGPADCRAAGPASQLFLLLWDRPQPGRVGTRPVIVSGDAGTLRLWNSGSQECW